MGNCIFCDIVAGTSPAHTIWEDEKHLAFLSIFPNTEGFTVVIPKKHYSSYVFAVPDEVMVSLMHAAKQVGQLLDRSFPDVGRSGVIFEGFGIDHLHAKLIPLHGTKGDWEQRRSNVEKYFHQYEGYISSHDYRRADDAKLATLAKKIRKHA